MQRKRLWRQTAALCIALAGITAICPSVLGDPIYAQAFNPVECEDLAKREAMATDLSNIESGEESGGMTFLSVLGVIFIVAVVAAAIRANELDDDDSSY